MRSPESKDVLSRPQRSGRPRWYRPQQGVLRESSRQSESRREQNDGGELPVSYQMNRRESQVALADWARLGASGHWDWGKALHSFTDEHNRPQRVESRVSQLTHRPHTTYRHSVEASSQR